MSSSSYERAALAAFIDGCRVADGCQGCYPTGAEALNRIDMSREEGTPRVWLTGVQDLWAWCHTESAFGNVLFDVRPDMREGATAGQVLDWGVRRLRRSSVARSINVPADPNETWKSGLLLRAGFHRDYQVGHFERGISAADGPVPEHPEWRLVEHQPVFDDAAYVAAHKRAFETDYLTEGIRRSWQNDPGYVPYLDFRLEIDGVIAGFCVCWAEEESTEVGIVGVVLECRNRGVARRLVRVAMARIASLGSRHATLSTSNPAMRRIALDAGFVETSTTSWWSTPAADAQGPGVGKP